MKKYLIIAAALSVSAYMSGCGKKQTMEESQEPMTMETMSAMSATNAVVSPEAKAEARMVTQPVVSTVNLEAPAPEVSKPSDTEVQTALKNANFYAGQIDGKIGPKTKQAIEGFQKANNLKADGKVGPKTWALLSAHLNAPVEIQAKKKQ
ncbi:MAG: peptidoglycan-binding domain-containing protein [Candidatus Omnitrophota bacterium]